MVATTPVYDLPYQEGSDPPCFGPGTGCDNLESVWCDFVTLVEAQLDENDNTAGRTATAIPMARITFRDPLGTVAYPAVFFSEAPFDTVAFDTDDMVTSFTTTFGDTVLAIEPRRNGHYRIEAVLSYAEPEGVFDPVKASITIANNFTLASLVGVTPGGGTSTIRAATFYRFTDTDPIPRVLRVSLLDGWGLADMFFTSGSLNVYWHSDL